MRPNKIQRKYYFLIFKYQSYHQIRNSNLMALNFIQSQFCQFPSLTYPFLLRQR